MPIVILVLAMVATSPAAPGQQVTDCMAGSVWELKRHSMCTSGTRIQWSDAVVTESTAKRWKEELSHRHA